MSILLHVLVSPAAVASYGAERFAAFATHAVRRRGRFAVALSGGHTPIALYEQLARLPYREVVPWDRTHVFLADERCVPADSAESNFASAYRTLLRHVPIRREQIHRVATELPPEAAAERYSAELASVVGHSGLDLVLLGMGADGHIASLFPGHDGEPARLGYVARRAPIDPPQRITLTLAEIERSRRVRLHVVGEGKALTLAAALSGDSGLPAARVRPASGDAAWWTDRAAAVRVPAVAAALASHPGADSHGSRPTPTGSAVERKRVAAVAAAGLAADGMVLGLGTGSTVRHALEAIADRIARGDLADVVGIPTSDATESLARRLRIPLGDLADHPQIDLTIDGADEVDAALRLVKGLGAALVREKIVARASHRLAVVVDDGKWVPQLGTRAPLPLAVVPFGWSRVEREVAGLGADPVLRRGPEGAPVTTDDGLYIIDARFATGIADPVALEGVLAAIPGVAGTGLFLGLANVAFVGHPGLVLAMHA